MRQQEIKTTLYEYDKLEELEKDDTTLLESAKNIAEKAYAPYSKFHVGAALKLANGKILTANNQENAAYPSGLCAERAVIFYANANYPDTAILSLAITAIYKGKQLKEPVPPCGSCLQVILESEKRYNIPIRIILGGSEKIWIAKSIKDFLPVNFNKDMLE